MNSSADTKIASYVYNAWGEVLKVTNHTSANIGEKDNAIKCRLKKDRKIRKFLKSIAEDALNNLANWCERLCIEGVFGGD